MELLEFRDYYINEIKATALNENKHSVEAFIDDVKDIMINDYNVVSELTDCYLPTTIGNKAYKSMKIDAAYLELASNTVNLLIADFKDS